MTAGVTGIATHLILLMIASCSAPSSAPSSALTCLEFAVSTDPSAPGAPTAEAAREAWIADADRYQEEPLSAEGWSVVDGASTDGSVVFEKGSSTLTAIMVDEAKWFIDSGRTCS